MALALALAPSQKRIRPSASWAIDSEPIHARGIIIVKYTQSLKNMSFFCDSPDT